VLAPFSRVSIPNILEKNSITIVLKKCAAIRRCRVVQSLPGYSPATHSEPSSKRLGLYKPEEVGLHHVVLKLQDTANGRATRRQVIWRPEVLPIEARSTSLSKSMATYMQGTLKAKHRTHPVRQMEFNDGVSRGYYPNNAVFDEEIW
jgi:hypothetical protein